MTPGKLGHVFTHYVMTQVTFSEVLEGRKIIKKNQQKSYHQENVEHIQLFRERLSNKSVRDNAEMYYG